MGQRNEAEVEGDTGNITLSENRIWLATQRAPQLRCPLYCSCRVSAIGSSVAGGLIAK